MSQRFVSFKAVALKKLLIFLVIIVTGVFILGFLGILNINPSQDEQVDFSASGITFMDEEVGELTKEEIRSVVEKYEDSLYEDPTNAYLDTVTKGVIPGLPGQKLDVEQTVSKIVNAEPSTQVEPVMTSIPPEKTVENYQEAPIYQGNPYKEQVTFICNVAWGEEHMEELLNVLDEHEVKISFFFEGRWARNNPEWVRKVYQENHGIGNHAYSHYMMSDIDRETVKEEIDKTNEVINNIIGEKPRLFGPPAGDFDEDVLKEASELNMRTILWSLDTIDWKEPGVAYMVDKITKNIHPGAIILIHPTQDTVEAVDQLIPEIRSEELEIVPADELIRED